jgi:hypothetical protein
MVFKKGTTMEYQDRSQIAGYPVEIANRQTERKAGKPAMSKQFARNFEAL